MDWLQGMNGVIDYIEDNLTGEIDYDVLAKILCCSTYEFSRIFSFMVGIPVSEYIRNRRLSQAAFDLQDEDLKIIDIGLKYGYESPNSFSRAFRDLHGASPQRVRQNKLNLKTYPKLSFKLTIKGVEEMVFRIVEKEAFSIIGLKGTSTSIAEGEASLDPLWSDFMTSYDKKLWNGGGDKSYYQAPFWQVGAYWNKSQGGLTDCIIGAELGDKEKLEGMAIEEVAAATWAVFTIHSPAGTGHDEAYARIHTEWFPTSQYEHNKGIQNLEVYPAGDGQSEDYKWEIWMPVSQK